MHRHPHAGNRPGPRPGPRRGPRSADRPERPPPPAGPRLLHADDHLVAASKPAGQTVAAPHARRATTLDATRDLLKRQERRDPRDRQRLYFTHDLDRDASGVVVFARHARAQTDLRAIFDEGRCARTYLALVAGEPAVEQGEIRSLLGVNKRGVAASVTDQTEAQMAPGTRPIDTVTRFRVVGAGNGLSLLKVRAETDAQQQVRAHLAEMGCPVVGDKAFASPRDDLGRLALHRAEVAIDHPADGRPARFIDHAPASFWEAAGLRPPKDAPRAPRPPAAAEAEASEPPETGWDHVADWYDAQHRTGGSDHYRDVVLPGTLALLGLSPGERVLDIACGQGVLSRELAAVGARVNAVDASPQLIEAARARSPEAVSFDIADARDLLACEALEPAAFDAAACVMALMNVDPLEPAVQSAADALRPGGRLVVVLLHPVFRSPRQTAWGWEGEDASTQRQHRRIASYLSPRSIEIVMNPGEVAAGADPVTTTTHHRPVELYVRAMTDAGLVIDAYEEWPSRRRSDPGPRAREENRARAEIPMFLAIRARKPGRYDPPATAPSAVET